MLNEHGIIIILFLSLYGFSWKVILRILKYDEVGGVVCMIYVDMWSVILEG